MRTPTIAMVCSLLIGCAPLGKSRNPPGSDGPDAGTTDKTCNVDDMVSKTMDLTYSGTANNLPTGCWKLNGKLTISGAATSLEKLGDLRGVSDLVIDGAMLTKIDTAMPLKVTRSIDIKNTTALTDLSNIELPDDVTCLTYLASVSVVANSALTDLGGVGKVHCVSGPTIIQNNVNLTAIALDQAQRLEGGLTIQDNTKVTSLSLAALQSVTGDINITHNVALTTMAPMPALQYLHGGLIVTNNSALVSLPSALGTTSPVVEGALTVTQNPKLTDLGQLSHLRGADGLITVSNNASLTLCVAQDVGCCVPHNDTPQAQITNNKTNTCGSRSWCYDAQGGCYNYAH
jgi:hypothetical protein